MSKKNSITSKDMPECLAHANRLIDEEIFAFNNSCSATDCTGLIPTAPVQEGAIQAYEAVYPFLPPTYGADDPDCGETFL